ncbi:MAG TPA: general secretion pathway protein GspB [Negativicutes bacterium]|jgi:general secretion pathway protein B
MSSILKALKKLEDEKTIRKPNTLHINSEILRDATQSRSFFTVVLVAAVIFLGGGGTAYLIIKPSAEVSATRKDQDSTALTPFSTTAEITQQQEQPEITKTKKVPAPQIQPLQKNKATVSPAVVIPRKPLIKTEPQQDKPAIKKTAVSVQPLLKLANRPMPINETPALKVNGIAFQEESADRVAVVNGVTVSNGSVVEGVHVDDIQRDRIRFSFGGEKFDIGLGKANR